MLRLSILDPSAPVYYLIISGRHSGEDAMVFGAASFLSVKSSIRAARNLGAMLAALVTLHGCAIAQEAASVEEATLPSCEDQLPPGWLSRPITSPAAEDRQAIVDLLSSYNWALDNKDPTARSEEHTSELQSLMRISYDVFCLKKKK